MSPDILRACVEQSFVRFGFFSDFVDFRRFGDEAQDEGAVCVEELVSGKLAAVCCLSVFGYVVEYGMAFADAFDAFID